MEQTAIGYRVPAIGTRIGAVVLGVVLVALAAQVSIPLPGTPVPMTLQPMAVLLVGGLLGARFGALSMILYLAMGRSEEHTSELQSLTNLVCRLLLEKKNKPARRHSGVGEAIAVAPA